MPELDSVCVLANRSLLQWQVDALDRLVERTGVDVPLVVVNDVEDVSHPGFGEGASSLEAEATANERSVTVDDLRLFYHVLKRKGLWAFVLAEQKLSWVLGLGEPGLERRVPLDDVGVLADAERISCTPVPVRGPWCELPADVVDRIATETDVAVRFGFSLLTGPVLSEPKFGVLSFYPADVRRYRGLGPPLPFAEGATRAGSTLQLLTDELDGGNVVAIESVDISDARTLDEVYERVHERQREMLTTGVERLNDPTFEPQPSASLASYTSVRKRRSPVFAGRVLSKNLRGRTARARTSLANGLQTVTGVLRE